MGIHMYAYDPATGELPQGPQAVVELGLGNWAPVFEALGLDTTDPYNDPDGCMEGAELARRAMRALAQTPHDEGTNSYRDWDPRHAMFTYGGRRPGFTQEKLREVQVLAHWCSTHGWSVAWA